MNPLPLASTACCVLLLAACTKPQPPDKERPPEPQAATAMQRSGPMPTAPTAPGLRAAVQAPLEQARGVQDQVQKDAAAARAAIDAAGG